MKDKRLLDWRWRERVGFDNVMDERDIREWKQRQKDRDRRQSMGGSE